MLILTYPLIFNVESVRNRVLITQAIIRIVDHADVSITLNIPTIIRQGSSSFRLFEAASNVNNDHPGERVMQVDRFVVLNTMRQILQSFVVLDYGFFGGAVGAHSGDDE